jgi:hypothetical protein
MENSTPVQQDANPTNESPKIQLKSSLSTEKTSLAIANSIQSLIVDPSDENNDNVVIGCIYLF